jgi:hypothetical protein
LIEKLRFWCVEPEGEVGETSAHAGN